MGGGSLCLPPPLQSTQRRVPLTGRRPMSFAKSHEKRAATAPSGGQQTMPSKVIKARFVPDEFFGQQPTSSSALPNPQPLIENLTRCVIEILAGARDLDQISRWVTDDVYRHL